MILTSTLALLAISMAGGNDAIHKSVLVKASPKTVWNAWTTPEGAKSFFAPDAEIQLRTGGTYEMRFVPAGAEGERGSEGCKVLSFIPEKMLSFSWNAPPTFPDYRRQHTFVVVELEKVGASTLVHLTHDGFGKGKGWKQVHDYFEQAWSGVLASLKQAIEVAPVKWEDQGTAQPSPSPLAVLDQLKRCVGGVWKGAIVSPKGDITVEFTYELTSDGKGVRAIGLVGKGTPEEMGITASMGWDPIAKRVFYLDVHKSDSIYDGEISLEGEQLVFRFGDLGDENRLYKSYSKLVDDNTLQQRICLLQDGEESELLHFTLNRTR